VTPGQLAAGDPRKWVQVAAVVRGQIIGGDLRPGAPLTPGRIAEEQGVSRVTVTRAFGALAVQGLVRTGPRGYSVATSFSFPVRPGPG
jgi:DNA-binding GntR family transcriptional regulator